MPFCPQCRNENPELGAKCPRCADRYYVYEEALEDAQEDSYIGQKVADKFVIVAQISEGGMGTVYRALQLPVEREVALKVLRTELEDNTEVRNRFVREARAVSKINHPNIITLHDFGFDESDYPYMVMEYAPGQSLDQWIYERGITIERIVHVSRQILSALADAHDQGIVHRDLKPENIVVTGTGTDEDFIKLLDFGIARLVNEQATTGLTREGEVFGTPHYMSPEQAEGETGIGPEADVYAAGIMIYEMLCREEPFDAPKPLSILFKQINEDLPDFDARAEVTIPEPLEDLVRRATLKDPDDRFANAGEMLRALDQLADPEASNIIEVPAAASGAGGADSDTMLGTGTRPVPEDKQQREEVATANTLGFDDADSQSSQKLESVQSNEVEVETPAGATLGFPGEDTDRNKRIALVGGVVLLVGATFSILLLTGSDDDGGVAADDRAEGSSESAAAVAGAATSAGADAGAGSAASDDAGAPSTSDGGAGGNESDAGPSEETGTEEAPRAEGSRESDPSGSAGGADSPEESDDRTGSAPSGGGPRAAGSSDTPPISEEEDQEKETQDPAPSGPTGGGADEPPTGSGSSETATDETSSSEEETELEKFGAPESGSSDSSDEESEPDKFGAPE